MPRTEGGGTTEGGGPLAGDAGGGRPGDGPVAAGGQRFRIGVEVICAGDVTDASPPVGRVTWVVVDPVAQALTHLVVEPAGGGLGRLVPLPMVVDPGPPVRLGCTADGLLELEEAEESHFFPGDPTGGFGGDQVLAWPYLGLAVAGGLGPAGTGAVAPVVYDRVPAGEVEVRRGDRVRASDGEVGSVQGLVVDPADHRITHVLLREGHLWGRKQVAIPVAAVSGRAGDAIEVALSREEIRDLPPVDLATG